MKRKRRMRGMAAILSLGMTLGLLTGCQTMGTKAQYSAQGTALDTYVSVTLYGCGSEELAEEALGLCDYYEEIFSRTSETSLLYQANEEGGFIVAADDERTIFLADLIRTGITYGELTDGALDITVEPLTSLWNFGEAGTVPSEASIDEALETVDYTRLEIVEDEAPDCDYTRGEDWTEIYGYVDFHGAKVELGAIAKGYIADRIRDYLVAEGVDSALINLGGNILTIGQKYGTTDFTVGLQKPFGTSQELLGKLSAADLSVVTSGVYERYFYAACVPGHYRDGEGEEVLYHHILDPKTGYPVENDLYAVTILAADSTVCDALSTGCFVLGLADGMALVESLEGVEAVMVDSACELHYSSGAMDYLKTE